MKKYEDDIKQFRDVIRQKIMAEVTEKGTIKPTMATLFKPHNEENLRVIEANVPIGIPVPGSEDFVKDTVTSKIIFMILQQKVIEEGKILCFTFHQIITKGEEEILVSFFRNDGLGDDKGEPFLYKIKHSTHVTAEGELLPIGCEFEQVG